MSKSNRLDHLSAIFLLVCAVAGCKQLQSLGSPRVLKSPDGKFQITVPAGWRENASLSDKAEIKAGQTLNETYVIVITEPKADFTDEMTLDQYTKITRDAMISKLTSPEPTEPVEVTINGNSGRQYEIRGATENVKIAYLVTSVETAEHYHQIVSWTLLSRIDKNKAILQQVTETFRPTTRGGTDGVPPPG